MGAPRRGDCAVSHRDREFDVIVVGGGHAGAEAAWAAARIGASTAMVTFNRDAIGRMSCNPAIGGIGKGQMVREIDALGGIMGIAADEAGIQFRMLNRRKGPAVWAPRAQCDSDAYPRIVRRHLEGCPNLSIVEAGVDELLTEPLDDGIVRHRVTGVVLNDGTQLRAPAVVITSGTFLGALMHCGERQTPGGRVGEAAAAGLSRSLATLGLELGRLKTGTPPRVSADSVDLRQLEPQPGDPEPAPFSLRTERITQPQIQCWLTYTNPATHALIRDNLHRAPMFSGQIESPGPRYCPSIEDKVVRFADKERHQVYVEPETRDADRLYLNGISTSLPQDVQQRVVNGMPGLEQARIVQWGYAVEYDFVPPVQIDASLMTKRVRGLLLAGQINGTSGYEEAAGQGLIAGINASRFVQGREPLILQRDQAYIGVMIDDLVTRGVLEPYRMFTSRAEHRLHLRYDNADTRLTPIGREVGLVDDACWAAFSTRQERLQRWHAIADRTIVDGRPIAAWLKRPEEDGTRFRTAFPTLGRSAADEALWQRVLVDIKYSGYIRRQQRLIDSFRELEDRAIPTSLVYEGVPHLRREAVERWSAVRPRNLGQASRVSGVHPSDLSILMVYLAARDRTRPAKSETEN